MIQVYFAKHMTPATMVGYKEVEELPKAVLNNIEDNNYEFVADINYEASEFEFLVDFDWLETAWKDTQSLQYPWYEDEKVSNVHMQELFDFKGIRSSMVSDIFVVNGRAYIVRSFGFELIGDLFQNTIISDHFYKLRENY